MTNTSKATNGELARYSTKINQQMKMITYWNRLFVHVETVDACIL